ncbi:MAG: cyclic nucleotide-binding domain-containing protein [Verrucomicrobia bacterium]|nr:cyclic nucleotide-binding domain-containing protein [Verrucomicrobiota bacterium]
MEPDDLTTGYQIWATDNVIYGPVELPTLVNWVQEERVLAGTWVYSGSRDAWQRAAELEELDFLFRQKGQTGPPTAPVLASRGEAPVWIKPAMLRRIKVFANMNDAQLERLLQFMEVAPARQWALVVKQGDPGDAMFLVLDGEVRVRLLIAGKETTLTTLGPGEFFGEFALFDHGPRSADVVANKDALLLKVSAAAVQKLANAAPDLAAPFLLSICRTLTARIRADNKRFQDSVRVARAAEEL